MIKIILSSLFVCSALFAAEKHQFIKVSDKFKKFADTYCASCHNDKKTKGDFRIDNMNYTIGNGSVAQGWQDILDVLNLGEMPPEEAKKEPSKNEMSDAIDELTLAVRDARHNLADSGGRPVIRRLNKRELKNILEELLVVNVNVDSLPDDDKVDGFDTLGDSLTMSSLYIDKVSSVVRESLDKIKPGKIETSKVDKNDFKNNVKKTQESLEKYKQLIAEGKVRNSEMTDEVYKRQTPSQKTSYELQMFKSWNLLRFPGYESGKILAPFQKGGNPSFNFEKLPEGKYKIRFKAAPVGDVGNFGEHIMVQRRSMKIPDHPMNWLYVDNFHLSGSFEKPQIIEFDYEHRKDLPETIFFKMRSDRIQTKQDVRESMGINSEAISEKDRQHVARKEQLGRMAAYVNKSAIWFDYLEVEGPIQEKRRDPHAEIFFKGTEDNSPRYVKEIIYKFASRALRGRQVHPQFLENLMAVYQLSRDNDRDFEASIKDTLVSLMSSPYFIYLVEEAPGKQKILSNLELANRLAIFLWSSMPDERLLALAKKGQLLKRSVLTKEIQRMLLSKKSDVFFESFTTQWLELDRILNPQFVYAEFDDVAIASAKREPIEFFKEIIRSNLGLDSLIDSDFVVINSALAKLYDIRGVDGMAFRKVALPKKSVRGGLLAQAGILAQLSDGHRNLTIERGAFVLRKLVDNPPASPPPNVPLLVFKGKHSTRDILEKHKEAPACASCHRKIDPLGFGLENFNAIGMWRDKEVPNSGKKINAKKKILAKVKANSKSLPIDAEGVLDGHEFANFLEMRQVLAANYKKNIVSALTKALIHYGVGRTESFTDRTVIEKIIKQSEANQFKGMDFMVAFIESSLFLKK